jgi:peptide/nickel transport system substrate-binding protein
MNVKKMLLLIMLAFLLTGFSAWAGGQTAEPGTAAGAVPQGKYNEAPMLTALVAAGELPPVDERLPNEPYVVEPFDEIGQYGGTLNVFNLNVNPWGDLQEEPERGNFLLRMTEDGEIVGDLAKGYELADDAKSITIFLREGLKWSDGAPLTADDILFMYEDMHWDENVSTWGMIGAVKRVIKLDDHTVRFEMDTPYPVIVQNFHDWMGSDWGAMQPKHYMQKFHIKYNDEANQLAKDEGYENWFDLLNHSYNNAPRRDLERPNTQAWILKEATTTLKVFERNPYYHIVDTARNQLPYVDQIVTQVIDQEAYHLKVISGEADLAFFQTSLTNYTLYRENEAQGGYRVVLVPGPASSEAGFWFNQNHGDPALAKLLGDVRFRRALSLAINREEINDVVFLGLATPRQGTINTLASFYKEEWGKSYADYDPARANRLLDELGLDKRDSDGFRIGLDGKVPTFLIEFWLPEVKVLELVKEYWEAVGIKAVLKYEEMEYWRERKAGTEWTIVSHKIVDSTEVSNYISPGAFNISDGFYAPWDAWLDADADVKAGDKKLADFEGGVLPGVEPPEVVKEVRDLFTRRAQTEMLSREYTQLSQRAYDIHSENLWQVGTVGLAPVVLVVNKNIGNVPTQLPPWGCCGVTLNYYGNQLYIKQ